MGFFHKAKSLKAIRTKNGQQSTSLRTFANGAIPEVVRAATSGTPALGGQLRQRYALLLASVVATSAIACGAEDPSVMNESASDLGKISQDITGGTRVADNNGAPRNSVVKIQVNVFQGAWCTGLKVAPTWYLTANHCGFVNNQDIVISNGLDGVSPSNDHRIVQVFDHPTTFVGRVSNAGPLSTQWDLALVQVEYDNGIPAHTPNYIKHTVGDTGTFFGYGCDNLNAGNSFWKQFAVSSATGNTNASIFSASARPSSCSGDSGGPFFKIVNGVFRLEGVDRAGDGTSSYWNRVFGASQWIDAVKAGLPGINDLVNGKEGTFLSKTSNYCLGNSYKQWSCAFREDADQRFTVQVSGANIRFVGQGNNAGQCLGVANTFVGTAITPVTCGTDASNWVTQNPDATGRYRQYKNVFAQHCMRSTSLGFRAVYDQQPCSLPGAYPDQYFAFSK